MCSNLGRNPKELQNGMGHGKTEETMNTYGYLFLNNKNDAHSAREALC